MQAPQSILDLVERFDLHLASYKSARYKKTQLRREFVDPFFQALGWDMDNEEDAAEAYKDVIHEDAIKTGGTTKAPDYGFRIGGQRKFYVEAMKPSVSMGSDISPAFQLRRYAWTAKLPLSILTDFEELAVYDCLIHKPVKTDKPSKARTLYLKYTDYRDRWNEIASVFSRQAVLKGSFDKYAKALRRKRGTAEVDNEFLKEIESWRTLLAGNLALRNPELSQRKLNFAVQRTIDRIIFLRICEDRGVERSWRLQALLTGPAVYPRLCELFQHADDRYNSGLFHFHKEKDGPEEPDNFTLKLNIDDKTIKQIISQLYYPDCPYEFSVLPADTLGQVYEQFLGKVIRLTKGHQAKIEDKPEVKKAGGVYYTPAYIVEYIVQQTVGKMLDGKTPQQVGALTSTWKPAKSRPLLTVLDPACGAGSFLIGAYQKLLDWHRDWYLKDGPGKHQDRTYEASSGDWRLTTTERKRILLSHIYGVDIDSQAVEVTKLSLLLKVLEGENQETFGRQLKMSPARALPDLSNNIKCGNALIGPEFYDGQQAGRFDEEEALRINAFDWRTEFAAIRQDGGFDAVIGNPPYVRIQTLKEWAPAEAKHYGESYRSAGKGNFDIYVVFVERGLSLLNDKGCLGFILPHKFFNANYGEALRKLISSGRHLAQVIHFSDQQVFANATTYTCLMFLDKSPRADCSVTKVRALDEWQNNRSGQNGVIAADRITSDEWNLVIGPSADLQERLASLPVRLKDVADRIFQGFKTGADPVFILSSQGNGVFHSKTLDRTVRLDDYYLRPLFKSGDFKRNTLKPSERVIIFPYRDGNLEAWETLTKNAPKTAAYLLLCKEKLESREKRRWAGPHWYCFSRHQALEIMAQPKILTADLNPSARFCFDSDGRACFTGGAAGGYGIVVSHVCYPYILGLLNSRLLEWFLHNISSHFCGGWFSYESRYIAELPIRRIDFDNKSDRQVE